MKYQNASSLLPPALLEQLQAYIQAGYLYIPAKKGQHRPWGEVSGYRRELKKRNQTIVKQYRQGMSMAALSAHYSLSVSAIKKIIYQK